jgi:hypothetical protein
MNANVIKNNTAPWFQTFMSSGLLARTSLTEVAALPGTGPDSFKRVLIQKLLFDCKAAQDNNQVHMCLLAPFDVFMWDLYYPKIFGKGQTWAVHKTSLLAEFADISKGAGLLTNLNDLDDDEDGASLFQRVIWPMLVEDKRDGKESRFKNIDSEDVETERKNLGFEDIENMLFNRNIEE